MNQNELSLPTVKMGVKALAVPVAITLGFALLYVLLTVYSPVLAKSSFEGMIFGKTLRLANAIRAFSLVTPFAAIGTFVGSVWMDGGNPFAAAPHSFINAIMGVGVYGISQKWGRGVYKDLILMGTYGLLSGLVVSLSSVGVAAIFVGAAFFPVFLDLVGFKMLSSMIIYMSGTILVRGYEYGKSSTVK